MSTVTRPGMTPFTTMRDPHLIPISHICLFLCTRTTVELSVIVSVLKMDMEASSSGRIKIMTVGMRSNTTVMQRKKVLDLAHLQHVKVLALRKMGDSTKLHWTEVAEKSMVESTLISFRDRTAIRPSTRCVCLGAEVLRAIIQTRVVTRPQA